MGGQPCIRGLRITVRRLLELVATDADRAELLRESPLREEEDLKRAPVFAAANPDDGVEWFSVA